MNAILNCLRIEKIGYHCVDSSSHELGGKIATVLWRDSRYHFAPVEGIAETQFCLDIQADKSSGTVKVETKDFCRCNIIKLPIAIAQPAKREAPFSFDSDTRQFCSANGFTTGGAPCKNAALNIPSFR